MFDFGVVGDDFFVVFEVDEVMRVEVVVLVDVFIGIDIVECEENFGF